MLNIIRNFKWTFLQMVSLVISFSVILFGFATAFLLVTLLKLLGLRNSEEIIFGLGFVPLFALMMLIYAVFWYIALRRLKKQSDNIAAVILFSLLPNIAVVLLNVFNLDFKTFVFDGCGIISPYAVFFFSLYSLILFPTYAILIGKKIIAIELAKTNITKTLLGLLVIVLEIGLLVYMTINIVGIENFRLIF